MEALGFIIGYGLGLFVNWYHIQKITNELQAYRDYFETMKNSKCSLEGTNTVISETVNR